MKKVAVTLTTIHRPTLLEQFLELHRRDDALVIDYIVIGDLKTPAGVDAFVDGLNGRSAAKFSYFGPQEQEKRFRNTGRLWDHLPFNSFARRNLADLMAYREGYDVIIRIDDDNFPLDADFFPRHAIAGDTLELPVLEAGGGWANICAPLVEKNGLRFYPRGFPFENRWKDEGLRVARAKVKVAINAGLWVGDPDVDAITRLCRPVDATRFDTTVYGPSFALAPGTWAPINTQNTAFARATIPAAFVSPHAGRYDDILSGYFLRRLTDHLGESVVYGKPVLNQIRNVHNYWSDLDKERVGGETIGRVCRELQNIPLKGTSYASAYGELVAAARTSVAAQAPAFYAPILDGMEIWAETFAREG